jgi:hypothetical protein
VAGLSERIQEVFKAAGKGMAMKSIGAGRVWQAVVTSL